MQTIMQIFQNLRIAFRVVGIKLFARSTAIGKSDERNVLTDIKTIND